MAQGMRGTQAREAKAASRAKPRGLQGFLKLLEE